MAHQVLDKEHGINREQFQDNFKKLDDMYRVTEKEEIEKYNRIGKTTKQFYEDQEMRTQMQDQKKIEEDLPEGTKTQRMKDALM